MRATAWALLLPLLILFLAGCSGMRSKRRIDAGPFAEQTIQLVSDISYGLSQQNAVHLRPYMDDPAVHAYLAGWERMRPVLRGVAAYSLALVSLSRSRAGEEQKVAQLADFLEELLQKGELGEDTAYVIRPSEREAILAGIRARTKLLDGLTAAQPLVDRVAEASGEELDAMGVQLQAAKDAVLRKVEADHAESLRFADGLREAQAVTFRSLAILGAYRATRDPERIAELRADDPGLEDFLPASDELSSEDIGVVEERITYRLTWYRQIGDLIEEDLELYNRKIVELDQIVATAENSLKRTRATIWLWSRAHARLAQGVTDPAAFDVMGTARQAMNAAMPW